MCTEAFKYLRGSFCCLQGNKLFFKNTPLPATDLEGSQGASWRGKLDLLEESGLSSGNQEVRFVYERESGKVEGED